MSVCATVECLCIDLCVTQIPVLWPSQSRLLSSSPSRHVWPRITYTSSPRISAMSSPHMGVYSARIARWWSSAGVVVSRPRGPPWPSPHHARVPAIVITPHHCNYHATPCLLTIGTTTLPLPLVIVASRAPRPLSSLCSTLVVVKLWVRCGIEKHVRSK